MDIRAFQQFLTTPELSVRNDKYGYGYAPSPEQLRPTSLRYAEILRAKMAKPYSRDRQVFEMARNSVAAFFEKAAAFSPIFSEADAANLATTCSMGTRSRSHAQPDEGRDVGRSFVIRWRPELLATVERDWHNHFVDLRKKGAFQKLDLVLPTGTSLGWPFLFPDDDAGSRTLVLAAMAAAVSLEKRRGTTLRDLYSRLSAEYTNRFIAPGWRYQHTQKQMPVLYRDGLMWTQNVEFRTRLIAMVDKVAITYNREISKMAVKTALAMPQHNQDRPFISRTFKAWQSERGRQIVAVDVSGFDNGFGGQNLITLLGALSRIVEQPEQLPNLVEEITAPMIVPYAKSVMETHSRYCPQLPSGASFTTAVGLIASDYITTLIAFHAGSSIGSGPNQCKRLSWGDDIVMSFPASVDVKRTFELVSEELQLSFDFEPTLKYLGFDYGSGSLQTNGGYSTGRLLQKSIFPESPTFYPYSIIGYVARLLFVNGDARFYHDTFTRSFWDVAKYGPPFSFDDRNAVLQQALKKASESPRDNRDTLNFLLHGLDPLEGQDLLSELNFDFTSWVGRSYIDVTDPDAVLKSLSTELATMARPWFKAILTDGIDPFISFVNSLVPRYNWRREGIIL